MLFETPYNRPRQFFGRGCNIPICSKPRPILVLEQVLFLMIELVRNGWCIHIQWLRELLIQFILVSSEFLVGRSFILKSGFSTKFRYAYVAHLLWDEVARGILLCRQWKMNDHLVLMGRLKYILRKIHLCAVLAHYLIN